MRGLWTAVGALMALAAPVAAQSTAFDGAYKLGETGECGKVGEDGGALKIADGVFYGVESQCSMLAPVNVRDMDAVLYDMKCSGEGDDWRARALFMRAADGGLIMLWNGYAFQYSRCPDVPARKTPAKDLQGISIREPGPDGAGAAAAD